MVGLFWKEARPTLAMLVGPSSSGMGLCLCPRESDPSRASCQLDWCIEASGHTPGPQMGHPEGQRQNHQGQACLDFLFLDLIKVSEDEDRRGVPGGLTPSPKCHGLYQTRDGLCGCLPFRHLPLGACASPRVHETLIPLPSELLLSGPGPAGEGASALPKRSIPVITVGPPTQPGGHTGQGLKINFANVYFHTWSRTGLE